MVFLHAMAAKREETIEFLHRVPVFSALARDDLARVAAMAVTFATPPTCSIAARELLVPSPSCPV